MRRVCFELALLGMVLGLAGCGPKPSAEPAARPVVFVAEVIGIDQPGFEESVATLVGSADTPVQAQVSGYLLRQDYVGGSVVQPGDLLFQIDPRPFKTDLDLARTRITAPRQGVAARAIPGVGDYIRVGATLTVVSTVDPIEADFILTHPIDPNNAERRAGSAAANLELVLADGTIYPFKGRLTDSPAQKAKPGAFAASAIFPNPNFHLRPGQYVKVRTAPRQAQDEVLIPARAVTKLDGNAQVWVLQDGDLVEPRQVALGDREGSRQIVTAGLKRGERIVVQGLENCREGIKVAPQRYVMTPDEQMPASLPSAAPSSKL